MTTCAKIVPVTLYYYLLEQDKGYIDIYDVEQRDFMSNLN